LERLQDAGGLLEYASAEVPGGGSMNDQLETLLGFGVWVSLLCFALCVAGFIGDKIRNCYDKRRRAIYYYGYLNDALESEREAQRGRQFTASEVLERVARAEREACRQTDKVA
jgi:hypothetical protein